MSFAPRSLRMRTALLIVVAVLAAEALTLAVFAYHRHSFLDRRGGDFTLSTVNLVRAALLHDTPEEVARFLQQSRGQRFQLIAEPPPEAMHESRGEPPLPPDMLDNMRDDFGVDAVRFSPPPDGTIWIRVAPGGWWLQMPFARFEAPIPWPSIIAMLIGVAMIAAMVALYTLHLSRPLRALTEAAGAFEVGQRPMLPLTGPDEIRAVTAQFNAMAERLAQNDAERRVMLAGLPHDLRAPLTRAKLRLAVIEADSLDASFNDARAGFEKDLTEIERIADQFVAYLRATHDPAGDRSRFNVIDPGPLVRERATAWQESGQAIILERIDVARCQADAGSLARALDNLIGNALAHGRPPVTIRAVAAGNEYRIEVGDCGAGIPAPRRAEALRPFVRLDAARGRVASGGASASGGHCGLGLALVLALARLHGGRVELGDAPGGGLLAVLALPLVSATAPGA